MLPELAAQQLFNVAARIETVHDANAPAAGQAALPPAAIWLSPLHSTIAPAAATHANLTLLQKNKEFSPHLLVVPVGSVVRFPNADPFFHNVFSLFNGKRFDLGLYEAGSSREVFFGREGISYIFCNIHPEMSAVIISLSTPFYAIADADGRIRLEGVPAGTYVLHIWVEGEPQPLLDKLTRTVQVSAEHTRLGTLKVLATLKRPSEHKNQYGQPYDTHEASTY